MIALHPNTALRFSGIYHIQKVVLNGKPLDPKQSDQKQAGDQYLKQYAIDHAQRHAPADPIQRDNWFGSALSSLFNKHAGWEFLVLNDEMGQHFQDWNEGVIARERHQSSQEAYQQKLAGQAQPVEVWITTNGTDPEQMKSFELRPHTPVQSSKGKINPKRRSRSKR